jgi:hypothetical protein
MDTVIEIKPRGGDAATRALDVFRRETQDLSPYLAGISVNLAEGAEDLHGAAKSVSVKFEFRRGGSYLSETRGGDWTGLLPAAAARAAHGARTVLEQRWEWQGGRP